MAALSLVFDILARDKASSEFKKVGDAAESAGKRGSNSISSLAGSLKGAGAAIAGSAIVAGLGSAISAASDLSETVNKSNVIFGANSREIQRWSSGAAKNLGLSKGAALEAASGFGNMFTQLGFTGDAASDMATQVVQLSADLGSFNNLPTADVADMMSAAFRGEFDSLQALIPNINAARVEQEAMAATGKANAKELTAQEKAAAVLAIVQKDGAAAAGDFARTSDGLANSQKILTAEFQDLQAKIGEKFLPVASAAVGFLADTAIPVFEGVFDTIVGLVEGFNDLPGPVKATAVALGAVAALRGPLGGLGSTLSSLGQTAGLRMLYLKDAVSSLPAAASAARRGLSGISGLLGGPWGLAITAATAGISLLASSNGDAAEAEEAHKSRVTDLTEALRESSGEITDNIRLTRIKTAQDEGLIDAALRAGVSERDLGDALNGNDDALRRVVDTMNTYALRQTERIGSSGEAARVTNAEGRAVEDAADKIAVMGGEVDVARRALDQQKAVLGPTAEATGDLAGQTDVLGGAAQGAAKDVRSLRDQLDDLTGKTVSSMEAEIRFEEAISSAREEMKDLDGTVRVTNGRIDLHSEAGRAAAGVLLDLRDSSNDVIDSLRTQGASAQTMAKRDAELRVSFIKTATQMGIGRAEAKKLADQILGVPRDRKTAFTADTQGANNAIDNLQENIRKTNGKDLTIRVRAAGRFIINPQGGLQEFWKGGYTGPGGRFDVKGLVHGDEFVVPKSRVNALGGPRAVAAMVGMGSDFGAPNFSLTHDTRALENSMESLANAVKEAAPKPGVAGTGSVGGGWQSIWNWVKARIPAARINSTYRPGDPGYHGRGKAIDFGYGSGPGGAGSAGLALINRTLHDGLGRNLAELIYDGIGDDRPDIKNGRPLLYNQATRFEHRNHVHAAVYDSGGILPPGLTMAYNGTGRNEYVTKSSSPQYVNNFYGVTTAAEIARTVERSNRTMEFLRG